MKSECRRYVYGNLLCLLLALSFVVSGCTNPEKAKAEHLSKGEAYLSQSKFQEASLEFRNALQIDDKLAAGHWGLARAYEGLQRFPEMIDELRKTVATDAENLEARIKLGTYYLAVSKGRADVLSEAEQLASYVLKKDPKNIEGHILMGGVYFAKNEKDKAFAELNQAIELDPKRVESYLGLARFYIVTRDTAKAEETFHRALAINANSPIAHMEFGRFLVRNDRAAEGEAEFKKAIEVAPDDRPARVLLASYYLGTKQFDKAEEAYKAVAELDKDKPEGRIVLADYYYAINRSDEAVKISQEVLDKSPDYVKARYRLAELLMLRGDLQGATAQVEEALKKDANDRQALILRARIRSVGGQADGLKAALEDLNSVLKQEPNSRNGLYLMAQTQMALGFAEQARNYAADLERNYPDYLPAKLMQAQLSLSKNDTKSTIAIATDLINRLAKMGPDAENTPQMMAEITEKAYLVRATAQLGSGKRAEALKDLETARSIAPNDPAIFNTLAVLSASDNKLDEAIGLFENSLKIDPTNFDALNGLITIYAQKQQLDQAHARIDQAIASNPNKATVHFLKAQVYSNQHNAQGVETELRKALELDPNYIAAYSALGAMFVNTRQEDRAIAEYKKIIEIRPDNAAAYTLIGMLEDARKNYDVSVENYKKALEQDQNAAIAANNLAWLYAVYGKGNIDEAVRLAQGVVQKNPTVAGFADTLGWVYYKKGLHGAAVEQLQKAVAIDEAAARANKTKPSATYHFHLGMALKARGDTQASKKELETALRLAENFPDADEARKTLASL